MPCSLKQKVTYISVVSALLSMSPLAVASTTSVWIEAQKQNQNTFNDIEVNSAPFVEEWSQKTSAGVLVKGSGDNINFSGDKFIVNINDKNTKQTSGVAVNNGATVTIDAKNTEIDVSSIGSSGNWGFGLIVEGEGSDVTFSGENVRISNYQDAYTAQTLTTAAGSSIVFNNSGDVTVESSSKFGVTGVSASGKLTFNNTGDVLIKGTAVPGDTTIQTNVVGIQGTNGQWEVTNNVNNFSIELNGAGVDNDGSSYSTGTRGIDAFGENQKISIESNSFNISMHISEDVVTDAPEGHTSEEAYGIFLEGATLSVGANTTTNIKVTEGIGSAYGLNVIGGGSATFQGNTAISTEAKNQGMALVVNGDTYEYNNDGPHLIGQTPTTVTFEGNTNNIQGDVSNSNLGHITFSSGNTALDGNLTSDTTSQVELNKATIDLAEGNTIDIDGTLISDNGRLVLNEAREGAVQINTLQEGSSLQTIASSVLNDELGGDISSFSKAIAVTDGADGVSLLMNEGLVAGQVEATLNADGTVNTESIHRQTNSVMRSALDLASSTTLALNRILLSDLRQRLGDIRSDGNTYGVWARYNGGTLSGNYGLDNDFNTVQMGMDAKLPENNLRLGVAFSYSNGDASYARGNADMDAYMLSGYGLFMNERGLFVDVVGHLGTAQTDMTVDGDKNGSMDSFVAGLSAETGWRINLNPMVYVEPQIEASYTYVHGDDLSLANAKYDIDSVNSLIGRVGFSAGVNCPANFGNVYVHASVVHEFLGDAQISGRIGSTSDIYETNGSDTWFEYGIGANFNFTKSTYVYADVQRTSGAELDEDWRANLGIRYAW